MGMAIGDPSASRRHGSEGKVSGSEGRRQGGLGGLGEAWGTGIGATGASGRCKGAGSRDRGYRTLGDVQECS